MLLTQFNEFVVDRSASPTKKQMFDWYVKSIEYFYNILSLSSERK